ncbi:replication initiator [Kitasatospora sp. NPDC048538]|uniref:replication initiator n=1 Tax=unclassified Kitasatospora TaxID=2633591 RepID=UPI0033D1FE97
MHRLRRHRTGPPAAPPRHRTPCTADDMLGFRGHFPTKSRCYSVTLGALREARRTWRTELARAHAGLPDLDPSATLVISHWAYHGSGYSPGVELLAAAVWHRRELARQFTAEGGPS